MVTKIFEGILIVNWKNGNMKVRTAKRKVKTTPWEVPIQIKIKVNAPEDIKMVAEGEIEIPTKKVKEMFIHAVSDD